MHTRMFRSNRVLAVLFLGLSAGRLIMGTWPGLAHGLVSIGLSQSLHLCLELEL